MPDRPQPDESSGEPRCVRTCELLESVPDTMETMVQICGATAHGTVVGELCRPRIRELVQISRRRCDGCENWNGDAKPSSHCRIGGDIWPPNGYCHMWKEPHA